MVEEKFNNLRILWRSDPVYFCVHALGMTPTSQQVKLMRAIVSNKFIACKSGHGTGKSTALAALIWWFLIASSSISNGQVSTNGAEYNLLTLKCASSQKVTGSSILLRISLIFSPLSPCSK